MRQDRFKMEREGLVEEGQEVEISERSAVTGQYTYLVEPSIAMSGIYRTSERILARKGIIRKIEKTDKGFYLLVETEGLGRCPLTLNEKAHIIDEEDEKRAGEMGG